MQSETKIAVRITLAYLCFLGFAAYTFTVDINKVLNSHMVEELILFWIGTALMSLVAGYLMKKTSEVIFLKKYKFDGAGKFVEAALAIAAIGVVLVLWLGGTEAIHSA